MCHQSPRGRHRRHHLEQVWPSPLALVNAVMRELLGPEKRADVIEAILGMWVFAVARTTCRPTARANLILESLSVVAWSIWMEAKLDHI